MAHGPSFKEKTEIEPFENIEIYNLMCGEYICIYLTSECGYSFTNMCFEIGNKLNPRDGYFALRRQKGEKMRMNHHLELFSHKGEFFLFAGNDKH